jgi:hypothetical protein
MNTKAHVRRPPLKLVRDTDEPAPLGRQLLEVLLMLFGAPTGCVAWREPVAARPARPASALTVATTWVM